MKTVIRSLIMTLIIIILLTASTSASSFALIERQSTIIPMEEPVKRVAVGDDQIADVLVLSNKEVLVNAQKVGITSLHIWTENASYEYQLRVYADDGTLIEELQAQIGIAELSAWFIGHHLVLDGDVSDKQSYERALKIANAYSSSVIDLLRLPEPQPPEDTDSSVEEPVGPDLAQLRNLLGSEISVNLYGETLFLEGMIATAFEKERATAIAEAFHQPVVDLLRIKEVKPEATEEEVVESKPQPIEVEEVDATDLAKDALTKAQQELTSWVSQDKISVSVLYDHLVLEGDVESQFAKDRAAALAKAMGFPVINLVRVFEEPEKEIQLTTPVATPPTTTPANIEPVEKKEEAPERPAATEIAQVINNDGIEVSWIGDSLFIEGQVEEEHQKERAIQIGKAYTARVVDLIRLRPKLAVSDTVEVEPEMDLKKYQQELIQDVINALKEPSVEISFFGETLVLEGTVESPEKKQRAEQVAAMFYQPTESFLELPKKPSTLEELQAKLDIPTLDINIVNSRIILEGSVSDQAEHGRVIEVAGLYGEVLDLIHVEQEAQVLLQVFVLELDKTAANKLGVTWGGDFGVFNPYVIDFVEVFDWQMSRASKLHAQVEALVENGTAKLLASPSLLTLSGKQADFLVGGEIPVITDQGVEWKDYGVKLDVLPTVNKDHITVNVMPEVSSLDWNNALTINGIEIPAIKTRRASTSLRMKEGSTMVLGGLIQHEESTQIRKVPLLGDLPIIGALFRSKNYQENQTELVIMITPWIMYQEGVELHDRQ